MEEKAKILIGTCGFSYTEWVGPLYPEGTKRDQFLPYYAGRFNTVELDYTYYSMPLAKNIRKMVEDVSNSDAADGIDDGGAGNTIRLSFAVKAHETLTHKVDSAKWRDEAKRFLEGIEPLREKGCLEAVLFQFPFSFHYNDDTRRYLGQILDTFSGIPSAVEFRNDEWANNRVIDGLRERKTALVSLDMPDLKGLPGTLDVVTAPHAYFRFHGRNKGAWWGSDGGARYDYLYSDKELEASAERIRQILVKADRVIIYFNNHRRGQAVKNAETLRKILDRAGASGIDGGADSGGNKDA